MVQTVKFSEFVAGDLKLPDNEVVGLSAGVNARLPARNNYLISTPSEGFVETISSGTGVTTLILNPAVPLSSGTVIMPEFPPDGQVITISTNRAITTLTITPNTGQTIAIPFSNSLTTGSSISYIYQDSAQIWFNTLDAIASGGINVKDIAGDSGSISGSTVTIFSDQSTSNSGSSVAFTATSATNLRLDLSDSSRNTILGYHSGNLTFTGVNNSSVGTNCFGSITLGSDNSSIGNNSFPALTTGSNNSGVGPGSFFGLTTGSLNVGIGNGVGSNYIGNESNNILIGGASGSTGENHVTRIGYYSGGPSQTKCFIDGINIFNSSSFSVRLGVFVDSSTGQLGYGSVAALDSANTFTRAQSNAIVSLTSTSNHIATNATLSNIFSHTMTQNTTLDNPTNLVAGTYYTWIFTQDAGTARTLALDTLFVPLGTAFTITTTLSAKATLTALYDGTSLLYVYAQA